MFLVYLHIWQRSMLLAQCSAQLVSNTMVGGRGDKNKSGRLDALNIQALQPHCCPVWHSTFLRLAPFPTHSSHQHCQKISIVASKIHHCYFKIPDNCMVRYHFCKSVCIQNMPRDTIQKLVIVNRRLRTGVGNSVFYFRPIYTIWICFTMCMYGLFFFF